MDIQVHLTLPRVCYLLHSRRHDRGKRLARGFDDTAGFGARDSRDPYHRSGQCICRDASHRKFAVGRLEVSHQSGVRLLWRGNFTTAD